MHESSQLCPICLENVSMEIDNKKILKEITLKIEKDVVTGVIGPSGSGKSSFLRVLNKLNSYTGVITLKGQNYKDIPTRELRKRVGLVQQQPYLFPVTVRDNLIYGPNIWNELDKNNDSKLIELLNKVDLPDEFLDRKVDSLSGGEQQRVSLARSLSNNPEVLLLDEPTSSLDIVSEEILEKTIKSLSNEGIKIIIVTHSLEQTKRLTDQLLFLREGKFIRKTTTKQFFKEYTEEEIRSFFKKKTEDI